MDSTQKKRLETLLYSTIGIAAMALVLVAVNLIASPVRQRIDLTADHAYTLSPGTRAILAKLDTPVQVRLYLTRDENNIPVQVRVPIQNYARIVKDMLDEFRQSSKGKIEIQTLDPEPDTDAEDSAKLDGIEPQIMQFGSEPFYFGLSVTMLDAKEAEPYLDFRQERQLEYKLIRAISRVM